MMNTFLRSPTSGDVLLLTNKTVKKEFDAKCKWKLSKKDIFIGLATILSLVAFYNNHYLYERNKSNSNKSVSTQAIDKDNIKVTTRHTSQTMTTGKQGPKTMINKGGRKLRILYTMTSLSEYNSKGRSTIGDNSDRLQQTIIPVLSEGVRSMISFGYHVDVVYIAGYTMLPPRKELVRQALPDEVKLEFWEDAIPLGYDTSKFQEGGDTISRVGERKISLARQHRFVIKDNYANYDIFVNFEDDMLIKGHHVEHYINVSAELERLKLEAVEDDLPQAANKSVKGKVDYYSNTYYGNLTKGQLNRIIPGFIRVEVIPPNYVGKGREVNYYQIPFDDNTNTSSLDPTPCCHVSKEFSSKNQQPISPLASQLVFWETSILALGVRQMPSQSNLGWVAMLRGPKTNKNTEPNTILGDYWSGKDGYFGEGVRRPTVDNRHYINNQGGWMGTKQQIYTWHTQVCPGSFLPPFDVPHFRYDGLDLRDVEWWSGGLHLFTLRHACNMQRIVLLNSLGHHLLYHTANNKHKSKSYSKAVDLANQLYSVTKNAQRGIDKD